MSYIPKHVTQFTCYMFWKKCNATQICLGQAGVTNQIVSKTNQMVKPSICLFLGLPPAMQKVMYKGLLPEDKTLREIKVTNGAKIMVVGSTINDVLAVNTPKEVIQQEVKAEENKKEPLCRQKVSHAQVWIQSSLYYRKANYICLAVYFPNFLFLYSNTEKCWIKANLMILCHLWRELRYVSMVDCSRVSCVVLFLFALSVVWDSFFSKLSCWVGFIVM